MAWKDYEQWRPYRFFPWFEYRSWQARGSYDQPLGIYGVERRWRKS